MSSRFSAGAQLFLEESWASIAYPMLPPLLVEADHVSFYNTGDLSRRQHAEHHALARRGGGDYNFEEPDSVFIVLSKTVTLPEYPKHWNFLMSQYPEILLPKKSDGECAWTHQPES
jgi:hypothetical protein